MTVQGRPAPAVFTDTDFHLFKITGAVGSLVPTPPYLTGFRLGRVNQPDFFHWGQEGILRLAERKTPSGIAVETRCGTVDPALFRRPGQDWAGDWNNWEEYPRAFPESPEGSVLARELVAVTQAELERLPDGQRMVVTLRDMLGFDSAEVCRLLDISPVNQRVLLHRGRAAVRLVLESYLGVGP